jgi:hypothetical protein
MAKSAKNANNARQPNILVIWGDDIGQSNLQGLPVGAETEYFHCQRCTGEDE